MCQSHKKLPSLSIILCLAHTLFLLSAPQHGGSVERLKSSSHLPNSQKFTGLTDKPHISIENCVVLHWLRLLLWFKKSLLPCRGKIEHTLSVRWPKKRVVLISAVGLHLLRWQEVKVQFFISSVGSPLHTVTLWLLNNDFRGGQTASVGLFPNVLGI